MNIEYSTASVRHLVATREHRNCGNTPLFVTISPNPKVKHECDVLRNCGRRKRMITVKIPYGKLPQKVQYEYCINYFLHTYCEFLTKGSFVVGSCEFNKSGNVHLHILIWDPHIKTDYKLEVFRRDILNCESTLRNTKDFKDYMNNIVFVTKPLAEVIDYMDKDICEKVELFPIELFPIESNHSNRFKNFYLII